MTEPRRTELARAQASHLRAQPIFRTAIAGIMAILVTAAVAGVLAVVRAVGPELPLWLAPVVGVLVAAAYWRAAARAARGEDSGAAGRLTEATVGRVGDRVADVVADAAVSRAQAATERLGLSPAPRDVAMLLERRGHRVLDMADLPMSVVRTARGATVALATGDPTDDDETTLAARLSVLVEQANNDTSGLPALHPVLVIPGRTGAARTISGVAVCGRAGVERAVSRAGATR